ncbi:unnamed protein product [Prorocentrum cordatum]|uniref:TFIIS central domain-containing protein n=1 Tax=Prorocentrum cordatum TaxID=2364126 RepID=A0ABN9SFC5_9DINO|nr:unnamed protein product [Polarella glacialis]
MDGARDKVHASAASAATPRGPAARAARTDTTAASTAQGGAAARRPGASADLPEVEAPQQEDSDDAPLAGRAVRARRRRRIGAKSAAATGAAAPGGAAARAAPRDAATAGAGGAAAAVGPAADVALRRRVEDLLRRALSVSAQAAPMEDEEAAAAGAARRLEEALVEASEGNERDYKTRARGLAFNLRQNEELRGSLISGGATAEKVVGLHSWDMAREEVKEERRQELDKYFREEILSLNDPGLGWRPQPGAEAREPPRAEARGADPQPPRPRRAANCSKAPGGEGDAEAHRGAAAQTAAMPLGATLQPLTSGQLVRVCGLASTSEYNGKVGRLLGYQKRSGLCEVLIGTERKSVKPMNLAPAG